MLALQSIAIQAANEIIFLVFFFFFFFCQTPTQLGTQLNINWSELELELTLFSNVTTRSCPEGVWKVSDRFLEGV